MLLRNEGDLLPLDAAALGSVAVLGPLADSQRDTLGPVGASTSTWTRPSPCWTACAAGSGDSTEVRYAPGIRPAQRVFPSMFDMFPGNTPPDPRGLRRRGGAAAGRRAGPGQRPGRRGARRVAADDRRGRLAFVAGAARPPARAAAGRRRHRHAGRPAGDERAAARPALGRRARAGHPRHLVSRLPGRRRRRQPAARRRLARRQAALHLAAHRRPGADRSTRTPCRTSRRTRPSATGTRRARRCSRSATG